MMNKAGVLDPDDKFDGVSKSINIKEDIKKELEKENPDLNKIDTLKVDYQKEIKNYLEIYDTIKKDFNTQNIDINDNDDNYRTTNIPGELHKDFAVNTTYVNMANYFKLLNKHNISIDTFLDNPHGAIETIMNNIKDGPDYKYKGQTFGEKLVQTYSYQTFVQSLMELDSINRMIGGITRLEHDKDLIVNNLIAKDILYDKAFYMTKSREAVGNYFSQNLNDSKENLQTLTNLIIANNNNDDFNKYLSYDTISMDSYHTLKKFDLVDYLNHNKVDAKTIYDKVISTLKDSQNVLDSYEGKEVKDMQAIPNNEKVGEMIGQIQLAIESYILLTNPEDSKYKKNLMQIVNNPKKALKGIVSSDVLEEVKSKEFEVDGFKEHAIDKFGEYIKQIKDNELLYNQKVSELDGDQYEEYINIRDNEINRLRSECLKGNLPKEYYEKRITEVYTGQEDKLEASKMLNTKRPSWWHRFLHAINKNWHKEVEEYDNLKEFAAKNYLSEKGFISKVDGKEYDLFEINDEFIEKIEYQVPNETKEPIDIVEARDYLLDRERSGFIESEPQSSRTSEVNTDKVKTNNDGKGPKIG